MECMTAFHRCAGVRKVGDLIKTTVTVAAFSVFLRPSNASKKFFNWDKIDCMQLMQPFTENMITDLTV